MAKTYNSISSVSTGDVYTATAHNAIVTNVNNYRVPPMCVCARSTNQSMTSGTAFQFTSGAEIDTESPSDPMFSSGANTRITIRTAGVYMIAGYSAIGASAVNGLRRIYISVNGSSVIFGDAPANGVYGSTCNAVYVASLAVGAYIELFVQHDIGAAVNCTGRLHVTWLGQVS